MAYTTFPTSLTPSTTSSVTKSYSTLVATFGGKYTQVAADTVQNAYPIWALEFDNLSASQSATLESFLDSVGSFTYFNWTPPSGIGTVWRLDPAGWTKTTNGVVNTYQFNLIICY